MKKVSVNLTNLFSQWQQIATNFWFCGAAFDKKQGTLLNTQEIAQRFRQAQSKAAIAEQLNQLNGFFSLIWVGPWGTVAAVDQVRSRPLFIGSKEDQIIITDDAELAREFANVSERNVENTEEFRLTGYVTGRNTLFDQVKQLQAGECVIVGESMEWIRYYRYIPTANSTLDATQLMAGVRKCTEAAIGRLIEYANGRQIVIPLSGGYDSRSIALLLHQFQYPNIVTFSFGRPDCAEARISRLVAKTLGLPWHFVSYSNKQWQMWIKTEQFKHYVQKIHSHVSVPTIQAWPAAWQLLTDKVFAQDCIVVPGHTVVPVYIGNFFAKEPVSVSNPIEWVTSTIVNHYYHLRPLSKTQRLKWQKNLNTQIATMIGNSTSRLPASLLEEWKWQEIEAKYIVNSNRYYDSFGLDWWMPLWDKEVTDFWATVPYEYKRHHRLWIDFVKSLWQAKTSISPGLGHSHDETVKLKRVIKHAASGLIHTSLIQRWRHQQKLFGILPLLEGIKLDLMGIRMGVAIPSYLTGLSLKYCNPDVKKIA